MDVNFNKIASYIDELTASINRYTTLQAHVELYKCGLISKNEFEVGLKKLLSYSTEIQVKHFGKEAADSI